MTYILANWYMSDERRLTKKVDLVFSDPNTKSYSCNRMSLFHAAYSGTRVHTSLNIFIANALQLEQGV